MLLNYIDEQCRHKQVALINLFDAEKKEHVNAPSVNVHPALREFLQRKPLAIHINKIAQFMSVNGGFDFTYDGLDPHCNGLKRFLTTDQANFACLYSTLFPYRLLGVIRYGYNENKTSIKIFEVVTAIDARRHGFGKLLVLYVINHVKIMGIKKITLENMPVYNPYIFDILESLLKPPLNKYKFSVKARSDASMIMLEYKIPPLNRGNFYSQLGFKGGEFMSLELPDDDRDFADLYQPYSALRRSMSNPNLERIRPLHITN